MTAKTDMERVGLFKELGYHTIGDPYKSSGIQQFNQSATKGKQLLPGGEKLKSASNVGYFGEFTRIFDKESYSDPIKLMRMRRNEASKKKLNKDWVPVNGLKNPCGTGTYYGTFSGPIPHFEAVSRAQQSKGIQGKNFYTNPSKKGVGYGYVGLTLNKYPEYQSDKFDRSKTISKQENEDHRTKVSQRGVFRLGMHLTDYFDANPYSGPSEKYRSISAGAKIQNVKPFKPSSPTKLDGGMKAGCFDTFPDYSSEPYKAKLANRPVNVVNSLGKTFLPPAGPKSRPVNSVLQQNIIRSVNPTNYRQVHSVMSY